MHRQIAASSISAMLERERALFTQRTPESRRLAGETQANWLRGVPIEVLPGAYVLVSRALERMGGKPVLRMGREKAGPVVTDNGGLVIDADFGVIAEPRALHAQIKALTGVVETGIFPDMASMAYFGCEDGSVAVWGRGGERGSPKLLA